MFWLRNVASTAWLSSQWIAVVGARLTGSVGPRTVSPRSTAPSTHRFPRVAFHSPIASSPISRSHRMPAPRYVRFQNRWRTGIEPAGSDAPVQGLRIECIGIFAPKPSGNRWSELFGQTRPDPEEGDARDSHQKLEVSGGDEVCPRSRSIESLTPHRLVGVHKQKRALGVRELCDR